MDLLDLEPQNYEHARGMVDALNAAIGRVRAMSGVSYIEGRKGEAEALRRALHEFMDAQGRVVKFWRTRWPEPPGEKPAEPET